MVKFKVRKERNKQEWMISYPDGSYAGQFHIIGDKLYIMFDNEVHVLRKEKL